MGVLEKFPRVIEEIAFNPDQILSEPPTCWRSGRDHTRRSEATPAALGRRIA